MWKREVTIATEATKEQIWKLWSDVENWKKWDHEVEDSSLEGSFKTGAKGILKPMKGPKSKFSLESVEYLVQFTSKAPLPFATMCFTHSIVENNGRIEICHGIEITGLTTFIFSKLIGTKLISELPKAMKNLSIIAQNAA